MPLAAGDRLGPYEVLARLGAGGMGEVWKARDTRLDREVAIKTSAEQFTDRFEREARAVAALNHPHICHLHDVGPNYLVMEYIDGRPLEGPLPLPKALDYAAQILDALDAAHSKGITHRDLKPANILVSKQGIKLLDFGLAKRSTPLQETDVTQALTEHGQIVGTLNYISPEQLQAKEADARSDIFSFGLVFYEMLTGRRAFEGQTAASVIAAILEREPPSVAEVAPPAIDRVLRRCLAKDPDLRWQSARDLKAALELAGLPQAPAAAARSPYLRRMLAVALALAFASAAALWVLLASRPPTEERMLQFQIEPPPGAEFILGLGGGSAISPDGSMVAFVASTGIPKIWIHHLDSQSAQELSGTEGARYPFWSPDSRSLGFFANGKLKRVDIAGGSVVTLTDAPVNRGGTWNEEGTILFAPAVVGPLVRIPASGGATVPLAAFESARPYANGRWPEFLPGGRQFLYFAQGDAQQQGVYLGSLDRPGERPRLVPSSAAAHYVPPRGKYPGYLLWLRQSTPTVQVFDPARGQLSGEAVPVPGAAAVGSNSGDSGLSVSRDGAILLRSGRDLMQMTWLSREGKVLGPADPSGQADQYSTVRIAPDGRHAAVAILDFSGGYDTWTIDFARGVKTRVTTGSRGLNMIWSPDGSKVIHYPPIGTSLFATSATGAGPDDVIYQSSRPVYADDWSPDGRYVIYEEVSPEGRDNLWLLPMGPGDRKPVPYLRTSSNQSNAQVSPDGKWLSYTSDESGQQQVYVNSFPAAGEARTQVSNGGGNFARWRRDGKELFYRALDGRLMAASVRATAHGLEFGTPAALFRTVEPLGPHVYPYDVAPDNQRILALAPTSQHSAALTLLMNWQAKLKPQ